jgi:4-hydroxybenzoate polyprenyltransferase/phosphoserine phosphatase
VTQSRVSNITSPPSETGTIAEFLCTDLDGTILIGDSFWESLLSLVGVRPWYVFLIPYWLLRGKAALKREISQRVTLNVSTLPVREELVEFLRQQKQTGRKLILATGADTKIASAVAEYLGFFDAVLASNGVTNLTGENKKEAIREIVRGKGFDYIGNAREDIPIWTAARTAILVGPSPRLLKTVRKTTVVSGTVRRYDSYWGYLWRSLRPEHWIKNLLVFVPIVMAHQLNDVSRFTYVLIAFVSFSLCASGVYLLNDLFDLEADRLHPKKKFRPLASGKLPVRVGLIVAPLLILAGFVVAAQLPTKLLLGTVLLYSAATTLYSTYVKRIPILDVLLLTALYLMRILGGSIAADVSVSPWLIAFSMFLLLSLAFSKRQAELIDQTTSGENQAATSKRGYREQDAAVLQQFGVTSGYLSVLVLALYVNGNDVTRLYRHPQVIWLACPMLLFWISRVWFLASRGKLSEDPVVFAARDPISYLLGGFLLLILFAAS